MQFDFVDNLRKKLCDPRPFRHKSFSLGIKRTKGYLCKVINVLNRYNRSNHEHKMLDFKPISRYL